MPKSPDLIAMIRALVAVPTVSSPDPALDRSNRPALELLAGWLEPLGFDIALTPLPRQPHKANLVARLGTGPGGLALAGHMDTVPADPARWRADPWQLVERDDRLVGLGVADMKAFFALAVTAAARHAGSRLAAPLTLIATADEETSMDGALALLDAGQPLAAHGVIGEPTGLRPACRHKGVLMEAIRLTGKAAHSSTPALGNNALEGMNAVMSALLGWRDDLQLSLRDDAFPVPVPTLNLGQIRGGDAANRVCPDCELHVDLRLLPGMDLDATRARLRTVATEAVAGRGLGIEFRALFPGLPPLAGTPDGLLARACAEFTGHPVGVVSFGTEAPWFARLGMDCVILGPGDIEQAHQPDESLPLDRLLPTVDLLDRLVGRFCRDRT